MVGLQRTWRLSSGVVQVWPHPGYRLSNSFHLRDSCLPGMWKDRMYKVLTMDSKSSNILQAVCGCPAGNGPFASCKHIGALCFVLEELCPLGNVPNFLTCTENLQQWIYPDQKNWRLFQCLTYPAEGMIFFIMKKHTDLRQPEHRAIDHSWIEQLRCDLSSLNLPCAFLDILVPPTSKIQHDHIYTQLRDCTSLKGSNCPHPYLVFRWIKK